MYLKIVSVWSRPLGILHGMGLGTATKGDKKSVALWTYVVDKIFLKLYPKPLSKKKNYILNQCP